MFAPSRAARTLRDGPLANSIIRSTVQRSSYRPPPRSRSNYTIRSYSMTAPSRTQRSLLWQYLPRNRMAQRFRGLRNNSSQPLPSNPTPHLGSPQPTSLRAKMRRMSKEYGWVAVGVYLGLSLLDLPLCWAAVRLAGPERIGHIEHAILTWMSETFAPVWVRIKPVVEPAWEKIEPAKEWVVSRFRKEKGAVEDVVADVGAVAKKEKREAASLWTELALAYGIHKTLLIFVRVPLAVALTPKVARYLQSWGWKVGKAKVA